VSESPASAPPDWYPDPLSRHELRYWDGLEWTEHVSTHGKQSVDIAATDMDSVDGVASPEGLAAEPEASADRTEVKPAEAQPAFEGDGTIFGEPIVVVNQRAKVIEVNNEYAIYDRDGTQLGALRQIGQSTTKKVLRVLGSLDQYFTHKLQLVDMDGNVLLQVTRPAKMVKSRVIIRDGTGADVGEVVQENVFGKIRFAFMANGRRVGGVHAENWRAWDFSIRDADDVEVARVTKTFEGVAQTLFTTADNYVIRRHRRVDEPLQSFVMASALSIDIALKQDSRGSN